MTTKEQRRKALANNIETIRKSIGSTKRHVYIAAGMGQVTYDGRINGRTDFTFREIIDIADALNVSVSDLTAVDEAGSSERAA